MYSLLVGPGEDDLPSSVDTSKGRFLEYTSDAISGQLEGLSNDAIESIRSWPCIVMQEGRAQEIAHVVRIEGIEVDGTLIRVRVSPIASKQQLVNDTLWKLRSELDIGEFEFSRNHWAFKDRDLLAILKKAGIAFAPGGIAKFKAKAKPLPMPTRRQLLDARDVLAEWSHAELNDFLLEVGIAGLEPARVTGSRRDRANTVVEHALSNPTATTAENAMFSAFIVREAGRLREAPTIDKEASRLPTVSTESGVDGQRRPNRVFIVHGQNEAARASVINALERVGLKGIVLHEQPNMGRHLLTKFIDEADLVTFAVVLMTDDDVGSIKSGKLAPRARQNVILELGYFLSRLGQQNVCALITPGLETPSDFDGIVYIRMDSAGAWEQQLLRELRAAKMPLVE